MRAGGSHKTGVERQLLSVRARIQTALDALDTEELQPEVARAQLTEAEKALRGVELRLSAARSRPTALLEDGCMVEQTSADTRAFLLKNFTEQDREAADSHFEIQASSSKKGVTDAPRKRRSSVQECEDVHRIMLEPHVSRILQKAARFDFDALALADVPEVLNRSISVFGAHVVQHRGSLIKEMKEKGWIADDTLFSQAFLAFLSRLDTLYVTDAVYHGASHAVDVTATTEWFMRSNYIRERTTPLDHFMALAASALHDVGHPGKNNLWHSKMMSPLAIRYNDRSILENMHVALAFETMQNDTECDWFSMLPRVGSSEGNDPHNSANLQQYVRKGLISMVLATDMSKHSTHVQLLQSMAEAGEPSEGSLESLPGKEAEAKQRALDRKIFLLETVVHASDISNPCKPRPIMLGWTRKVLAEFWAQGDEERRLGLEVSPLCDRQTGAASVAKGQHGFITFVVLPFFSPLAELIVEAREAKEELEKNAEWWKSQDEKGATYEQIFSTPASGSG